ncbi:hypothetical protein E2C01_042635 [Portunus trituberculatus]|uniref:Uncharacterized protein n=1 Tax=Portunus trituberculatus TaxID=210409 RepID=A0A5B7FMB2_PORTR|nr:hypothetical protein [Portunus trituberculatus]
MKSSHLSTPHSEVLVGFDPGQPNSLDLELPGWVSCLHHHGPGLLGQGLEPQLLALSAGEVECLLLPPELVAHLSDHKGEVISIAQQDGVVEGQSHQLLHQHVEEEGTEDAALGRPILQFVEAGPQALKLPFGTAVLMNEKRMGHLVL